MLISPAYAQSTAGGPFGGDLMAFLPMVAIFVVFYFLLIRPQQKRAKETKAMLEALQKGDEVVTAGGIVGKISKITEGYADRRYRAERRDHRAAQRDIADAAQGHDQEPVDARTGRRRARSASGASRDTRRLIAGPPMNRYPAWKYILIAHCAGRRHPLHAAELLSRGSGGSGLDQQGQRQDRCRHAADGRGRAQGGQRPLQRRAAGQQRRQGPLRRPRHAAQGEGRAAAEIRRQLHRRAEPAVDARRAGWRRSARCRCISVSTCAAACTSCCRST